jgi:glycosyltransferase involved in cell wall biosynthesis
MAMGLPIVTVKEKGLAEILKDGINGFFARTDDPTDLSEKALKLLDNPILLKKFGAASRKLALTYSKDRITQRLVNFYKQLLK